MPSCHVMKLLRKNLEIFEGRVPIVLRGVSNSRAPKERLAGIRNRKEMVPNPNVGLFLWFVKLCTFYLFGSSWKSPSPPSILVLWQTHLMDLVASLPTSIPAYFRKNSPTQRIGQGYYPALGRLPQNFVLSLSTKNETTTYPCKSCKICLKIHISLICRFYI